MGIIRKELRNVASRYSEGELGHDWRDGLTATVYEASGAVAAEADHERAFAGRA